MGIFKKDRKFYRMLIELVCCVVSLIVTLLYCDSHKYGHSLGENIPLFLCSIVVSFFMILFIWEIMKYSQMIDKRIEELLRGSDVESYNIKARR